MGEVFKAVDSKLGRAVAIKILPADLGQDRTARRRFLQDARAASALNHPGIVTVHAIETADDTVFIVMELLAGTSVHEKIADGPVALSRVTLTRRRHSHTACATPRRSTKRGNTSRWPTACSPGVRSPAGTSARV